MWKHFHSCVILKSPVRITADEQTQFLSQLLCDDDKTSENLQQNTLHQSSVLTSVITSTLWTNTRLKTLTKSELQKSLLWDAFRRFSNDIWHVCVREREMVWDSRAGAALCLHSLHGTLKWHLKRQQLTRCLAQHETGHKLTQNGRFLILL